MPANHCDECRFWSKGYRLQGMKIPSFCDKHFHSQAGNDPACDQFAADDLGEPGSNEWLSHSPNFHPGDIA